MEETNKHFPLPPDEAGRRAALHETQLPEGTSVDLDELAQLARDLTGMPVALVNLVDDERVYAKASAGAERVSLPRGEAFCAYTVADGAPLMVEDLSKDERFGGFPSVVGGPRFRAYAGVPLVLPDGHAVGTLCVLDHEPHRLSAQQQSAMATLARSASRYLALHRTMGRLAREVDARRGAEERLQQSLDVIHRDIREAAAFVASMLPAPCDEPARVRWAFAPSADLGGDGLGHMLTAQGHLACFLLDVCGHGTASALLAVAVVSALRSDAFPADRGDPLAVVTTLNRMFPAENHHHLHFTLWYGVLDPTVRELRFINAGHPSPVLLRPGEPVVELEGTGPLVGIVQEASWQARTERLAPGDRVFVFSDGAYELFSPDGEGLQPGAFLEQIAGSADDGRAPEALLAFARSFCGREQLDDDFSMLELRV